MNNMTGDNFETNAEFSGLHGPFRSAHNRQFDPPMDKGAFRVVFRFGRFRG